MSLMSTMPDSQNSQSNQADQADQADAFTYNSNTANATSVTSAANATSVVSPTTSVSSTMSPTLIMGVMGGCIGLLVIALIVVVVYFVVVKSCGANGDSGGDSGGSGGGGGSGASCAAPSVTNDVLCTKNTDNTYSCVANCAQLKFPSGCGCSAKLNPQTSLCDITCPASGCNIDVFDANNPKTWVNLDSTGKCYGTAEVTGMVGSNTMYCQAVPLANGSYTRWATVPGTPKPSHLADGFLAVSGKTSTTPSDWHEIAYFCSTLATPDYPCTGLDVFYNVADNVSYYVACQADKGANTTPLATSAPTNSPNPFGPTVSATHYGAVLAMKDFPGVPPASSSSSMQSTLAKPSKRKSVPGW